MLSRIACASDSVSPTIARLDQKIADGVGVAALVEQRLIEIGTLLHHQGDRLGQPEDMIRHVRRRARSARRAARLDDHRLTLRRGNDAERPLYLEGFAEVVDRADLARIRHGAGSAIPYEGIGVDAAPQCAADIDEFLEPIVALIVVRQLVIAVVCVVGTALRRDDVEGYSAVRDVIERVQKASGVEWMHESRGVSQPETKMTGHCRHLGDPGAHFETRPRHAMAHGVFDRALPGVWNTGAVTWEDHIKAAALGRARNLFEHADVWMMPVNPGVGAGANASRPSSTTDQTRGVFFSSSSDLSDTDRRIPFHPSGDSVTLVGDGQEGSSPRWKDKQKSLAVVNTCARLSREDRGIPDAATPDWARVGPGSRASTFGSSPRRPIRHRAAADTAGLAGTVTSMIFDVAVYLVMLVAVVTGFHAGFCAQRHHHLRLRGRHAARGGGDAVAVPPLWGALLMRR